MSKFEELYEKLDEIDSSSIDDGKENIWMQCILDKFFINADLQVTLDDKTGLYSIKIDSYCKEGILDIIQHINTYRDVTGEIE